MKFIFTTVLLAASAVSPMLALDAELLRYIGPEAQSTAGIYVDRTLGSPLGAFLQSHLGTDDAGFRNFIQSTGFDPRRDLREVVMATTSAQNSKTGLIVARGTFNGVQLGAAAIQMLGGAKETYNGVEIYRGPDPVKGPWFAFPEPTIGVMGDEKSLKAALDRRTQALNLDVRLSPKIQSAGAKYDAWFATTAQPGMRAGSLKVPHEAVDVVSGGITLGSDVQLNAEAVMKTEKDAKSLVDVIRWVTGMLQMQGQRNPDMARAAALLQNAQTTLDGLNVLFSTSIAQTELEKLLAAPRRVAAAR